MSVHGCPSSSGDATTPAVRCGDQCRKKSVCPSSTRRRKCLRSRYRSHKIAQKNKHLTQRHEQCFPVRPHGKESSAQATSARGFVQRAAMIQPAPVFAAPSASYDANQIDNAICSLLEAHRSLLMALFDAKGPRVLLKVNMGCAGARAPADRYTSHPLVVESVIRGLQQAGAVVSFGDDVARSGAHCELIWRTTGMLDVANRTGARLVNLAAAAHGKYVVRWSILDITLFPTRTLRPT